MNKKNPITGYDWSNKTVLVVEDEDINLVYLEELLRFTKIKILNAYNGQEAVDIIDRNPDVSIILMDIKMPIMDGFQATESIKKVQPHIPIIAQTAHALISEKRKCFEVGCDAYLAKPLDGVELLSLMDGYLNKPGN